MNYKKSRDCAWQVLAKCKISRLPVSVGEICRKEHIRLITYKEGMEMIERLELREHTINNDAFSLKRLIFYDDTKPITRQRFSVAHELGHILLHSQSGATIYNRKVSPNDETIEAEANVFASRLLAPLCVLHELNVQSAEEIAALCNISIVAAKIRFERLCKIRERDRSLRRARGYGSFLLSKEEQRVFERFRDYIREHRRITDPSAPRGSR